MGKRVHRHIRETIEAVLDVPSASWEAMGDVDLADRIEANATELRAAARRGDAKLAGDYAKSAAAMAIGYLARRLA